MRRAGLAGGLLVALAAGCGDERPAQRQIRAATDLVPAVIPGQGAPTAYVTRGTWLRATPGGRPLVRLKSKTEFGSGRVLSIVGRRGPCMAVLVPELRNGRFGWLDARRFTRLFRVPYSIEVDLSQRRMVVRRLGRTVTTTPVGIGRPGSPTPTGRFAVTDRLLTGRPRGPYGCCILALTGHQPRIPQGWGGGDRLAIHATPAPETIGQLVSAGCVRASTAVMRRLVRQVPLGTPVLIRR